MAVDTSASPTTLPDYIQVANPNPPDNRAPWYKNTAPTYAGIFLWFVFWDTMAANGLGQGGLGMALFAILVAGLICHFLFYLVPGLFGMKTGLPLYIVGTSTFGAIGGLLIPDKTSALIKKSVGGGAVPNWYIKCVSPAILIVSCRSAAPRFGKTLNVTRPPKYVRLL